VRGMRREAMLREAFTCERGAEARGHGVIVRIASRAHRRSHAEQLTPLPEGKGSELGGFNRSGELRGRRAVALPPCVEGIEDDRRVSCIAHPTMRRRNTSSTTAR
jgi:hypothetical protein